MPYRLDGNCVVNADTGEKVPGGCHDTHDQAVAHLRALMANVPDARRAAVPADPDQPVGAPLYPPKDWFAKPAALQPGQKITVVTDGPDAGRVFGYVAPKKQCILSGRERSECWTVPDSPTNYAAAMQGEALTADGQVVKVANIGGDVDHAPIGWRDFRKVRDHYSNTASQIMRVAYGADEHGVWAAGALWPEITHRQAEKVRASALSGDWRWRQELGAYDMAGAQMVNTPGFPLVPTIATYAASLSDPHPTILGGWGGPPTEEPMPEPEPQVTLTLTASETARLHALLSGQPTVVNQSFTAAPGSCSCGGHQAAAPMMDDPDLALGGGGDLAGRVDALERLVEELRGQIMADALTDVDAMVAAMPLPPDLEDEDRWAMPEAYTAAFDESKHPRNPKGGTGGGRFRALVRAIAEEEGRVDPNDPRLEEAAEEGGTTKGKVVEQVNMVKRRIDNGTDAEFEETYAKSMADREDDDTLQALAGRGPTDGVEDPTDRHPADTPPARTPIPKSSKQTGQDFSSVQHGLLPTGTETPQGKIVQTSDTAYKMDDGSWVPFEKVHGPRKPAEPLVKLR